MIYPCRNIPYTDTGKFWRRNLAKWPGMRGFFHLAVFNLRIADLERITSLFSLDRITYVNTQVLINIGEFLIWLASYLSPNRQIKTVTKMSRYTGKTLTIDTVVTMVFTMDTIYHRPVSFC